MTFVTEFDEPELKRPSANTAAASPKPASSASTPVPTPVASAAAVKAESLTSELVKALHAAARDQPELYENTITPVLQDVIPRLPATSPRGQPLEWLDLRPLLESALEHTKQKVAPHVEQKDTPHHQRLKFLQECIAKPPFTAAAPASSTCPPALVSSALGSATSNANSTQQVNATAESQGAGKLITAEPSGAAVSVASAFALRSMV